MLTTTGYQTIGEHCRRAVVPACDPAAEISGSIPPAVDNRIIKVKKGDTIDVGIDWSQFFAANDVDVSGVTSLFAKHSASPKEPVFEGAATLYDKAKGHSIAVLDTSDAVIGDIYYIDCTVTLPGLATAGITLPTRTVRRTIHVRVVL